VDEAKNYIIKTEVELVIPAMIKEKMVGFMTLGIKKNNRIYTPEDINMFSILAAQAALAIENALFYHKMKEIQEKMIRNEKLAMMGKVAGAVGHDIRNPLSSIKYVTYYLNDIKEKQNEEFEKYISILSSEVENAEEIISSLLDLSKASVNKTKIHLQKTVRSILEKLNKYKNVKIKTDIPDKLYIEADQLKFIRLMQNLIKNALQAIKGEGVVEIKAEKKDNHTYIKIKDTGIGMDKETLRHIFEPLYTKKESGVGLGMSIIQDIIDKHGWKINARSEKGKGTEFVIEVS